MVEIDAYVGLNTLPKFVATMENMQKEWDKNSKG